MGKQYAVASGDLQVHPLNYLALREATVTLMEVDRVTGGSCLQAEPMGTTTVAVDGSWTITADVCDSCSNDNAPYEFVDNQLGVSLAAKVSLRHCPGQDLCYSVKNPSETYQGVIPFNDHGIGAITHARYHEQASLDDPVLAFQNNASFSLADQLYEEVADDPSDLDVQAAMIFASMVDVTRHINLTHGVPFKRAQFGEVSAFFPMTWAAQGPGHSHESSSFCVPAPRQTVTNDEYMMQPTAWPGEPLTFNGEISKTVMHEYGHLVNYRAWQGNGKGADSSMNGADIDWNSVEHFASSTKEGWADFIARVTMNDVTSAHTTSRRGCDTSASWDDDVTGADGSCDECSGMCVSPTACADGHRTMNSVVHALCDWFDVRMDGADSDAQPTPGMGLRQ